MKITIKEKRDVEVKFIKVDAQVRYWDDAEINGVRCDKGLDVPFKSGDMWQPLIDIETGVIVGWPKGTKASFHFKICDAGSYYLLDENRDEVASIINNYVPSGLCHGDSGFGDYIIFSVNECGSISNYSNKIDIEDWIDED